MGHRTKHENSGENLATSRIETNRAAPPAEVAAFMALLLLYSRQIKPARHIFTKYRSSVYLGP